MYSNVHRDLHLFNSTGQIFKQGDIFLYHLSIWLSKQAAHSIVKFATVGLQQVDSLLRYNRKAIAAKILNFLELFAIKEFML